MDLIIGIFALVINANYVDTNGELDKYFKLILRNPFTIYSLLFIFSCILTNAPLVMFILRKMKDAQILVVLTVNNSFAGYA